MRWQAESKKYNCINNEEYEENCLHPSLDKKKVKTRNRGNRHKVYIQPGTHLDLSPKYEHVPVRVGAGRWGLFVNLLILIPGI